MTSALKWTLAPVMMGLVSPAIAASEPSTKLVECAAGDCLLITGYREDRHAPVRINGREISVEGAERWAAQVPVRSFRALSAPNASTVTITIAGKDSEAKLPIGMMVKPELLTMLIIKP